MNSNDNRMNNGKREDKKTDGIKTRTNRNSFVVNPKATSSEAKIRVIKSTKNQTGQKINVIEKKDESSKWQPTVYTWL